MPVLVWKALELLEPLELLELLLFPGAGQEGQQLLRHL